LTEQTDSDMKPIIILKAWIEVLKQSTTDEQLRRANICRKCEYAEHRNYLQFINDKMEDVKGLVCTACDGCPIIAKVRSEAKCEKGKW
jgi:hypothetical protein